MKKKFIYILFVLVILIGGGYFLLKDSDLFKVNENSLSNVVNQHIVNSDNDNSNGSDIDENKPLSFTLSDGLEITAVGSYKGMYVEDGSNDKVKNVLAIEVKNTTGSVLQYCEITLSGGNGVAKFNVSTLYPGETALVMEANRQEFIKDKGTYLNASASNVVFFRQSPSFYNERLVVQTLDGALNVKNVSNSTIQGPIYIYYKNKQDDMYLGGITYRCKIDSLKAGEIKQGMTSHFSKENSEIVFITIGQ